jgi:hypothetical protein
MRRAFQAAGAATALRYLTLNEALWLAFAEPRLLLGGRAARRTGAEACARPRGPIVDGVGPQVRALLAEWPEMPTTVIAERIGWTRSLTVLKDQMRELRSLFAPPDPASRTRAAGLDGRRVSRGRGGDPGRGSLPGVASAGRSVRAGRGPLCPGQPLPPPPPWTSPAWTVA